MTSRFPERPSTAEAEGIPDPGYSDPGELIADDTEGTTEPPHDTAFAVDDYGTTAAEQHDGEGIDIRVAREEPDVLAAADLDTDESEDAATPYGERAGQGVGRLVESDEGAREDTEAELTARDTGTDLGGYSAEESAMHLEPEV